jgi:hypothetical protein
VGRRRNVDRFNPLCLRRTPWAAQNYDAAVRNDLSASATAVLLNEKMLIDFIVALVCEDERR